MFILSFHNTENVQTMVLSTGKPTYWLTDPNKKSDLIRLLHQQKYINYMMIDENIELSSDHTPIAYDQ